MPTSQEPDTAPAGRGPSASPAPGYYGNERPEVVQLVPAEGARILDVGCAGGAMGRALKQRGAREVVGIEVVPEVAAAARQHLDTVHVLDVQQAPLPYPDGHFDVITCADVLEHLVDPGQVLRQLRRYLRDDGLLVCSIPNVRHESVALRLLVEGRWRYEDYGILDRTHLRFYTLTEIRLLMREAGFSVQDPVSALRSEPSPYLDRTAALVQLLGGDVARFRDEATVIQYLFGATPVARRRSALDGDPWQHARGLRVLVAPRWDDPGDHWQTALDSFCAAVSPSEPITVGVVAPPAGFDALPPGFIRLLATSPADLQVLPAPRDEADWTALTGGARVLVMTSDDHALMARGRRAGLEVIDGQRRKPGG